jgi:hypothetical protein
MDMTLVALEALVLAEERVLATLVGAAWVARRRAVV